MTLDKTWNRWYLDETWDCSYEYFTLKCLQVLYKFLYLLDQSAVDHAEEAELRKHKASIVKEIRHNQQLEKEINEMDIKIG